MTNGDCVRIGLGMALCGAIGCSSPTGASSVWDTGASDSGGSDAVDSPSDGTSAGPTLYFHVRATTAPFAHTDGLSGQTTRNTKQGIRSIRLLRDASDPSPVVAFDHGKGFVEAGYDDKNDTVVGSALASKLPAARFTLAQIVVTHSRYRVSSTMHYLGTKIPGEFDCVQTLSDNTTLDGVEHPRSWYRYIFEAGGKSYPQEGMGAPLPSSPTTGGFTLKTVGSESYYEVAIDLTSDPTLKKDVAVVVEVNMNDSFRWEDQDQPDYAKGVYDTTPTSFEPIHRYGANSFVVRFE